MSEIDFMKKKEDLYYKQVNKLSSELDEALSKINELEQQVSQYE
jgi:prefoldin subunit 5